MRNPLFLNAKSNPLPFPEIHNLFFKIIFRIVNMVQLTDTSLKDIWKVVRKIKSRTLCEKIKHDPNKFVNNIQRDLLDLVIDVEEELGIQFSDQIFYNLSEKSLQISSEIYFYIKACPADEVTFSKQWFDEWFLFYNKLFGNESPNQILLTLNRKIKVQDLVAEKLFNRTSSLLSLKHDEIQKMMLQRGHTNVSAETLKSLDEKSN